MINWLHNGTYDDDWVVACDEMHINECLTSVVCVFLMHLQCTFFFLLSFRSLCISFHFGLSAYLCRKRQRIAVEETNVLVAASGGGGCACVCASCPLQRNGHPILHTCTSPYTHIQMHGQIASQLVFSLQCIAPHAHRCWTIYAPRN